MCHHEWGQDTFAGGTALPVTVFIGCDTGLALPRVWLL